MVRYPYKENMLNEDQGVNINATQSPDVAEQVVNPGTPDQAPNLEAPSSQQPTPAAPAVNFDVDEMGVPYRNRAMEYRRKYEDLSTDLKTIKEQLGTIQQTAKPQYSEDDLRSFSETTQDPYQKVWAANEIKRLEQEKLASIVRGEIGKFKQEQEQQVARQQVLTEVMTRYTDAFVKDQSGRAMGWDINSPMYQRIAYYMNDPEISNNPRGLKVAAALAHSDLALHTSSAAQSNTEALKREVRTLQNKTLVEGGGVANPQAANNPVRSAVNQSRTGNMKDAQSAFAQIMKAKGVIK